MTLSVLLLGRPSLERGGGQTYRFRSRKSWALLAYLILGDRAPTRAQLASLLFAEADDPLRALRWSVSEIRRALAPEGSIDGDPLVLTLPEGAVVDCDVVTHGSWADAVALPGLGTQLLEGMSVRGGAAFESWLLSEQRRLAAASEAILHEAALGSMSRGQFPEARSYAVRAAAMSPLDENHQALLIRLYRLEGDYDAADSQFSSYVDMLRSDLGLEPGVAVRAAMREVPHEPDRAADDASIRAVLEAGSAAVSAGAVETGVESLRTAVVLADQADRAHLRVTSRIALAEALIHALGGLDEPGLATLHEADRIALAANDRDAMARARAELGYVDFLRARYDRAEVWLRDALVVGSESPSTTAKATTYLGSVASDRADYGLAETLLVDAQALSRAAGEPRREAFALAMLGRSNLLRGRLHRAGKQLDAAIELAQGDHWLAFVPWPQALRGEVYLARGNRDDASRTLQQAFARACQLGDPCWEGISARGLALVAEAAGDTDAAFAVLADARTRCNRFPDPYVWLDVYILDALCELGRRHGHPDTKVWVENMSQLASRTGMREMTVRSMLHAAALGNEGDAGAAALLAADIDNPALASLLPA